MTLDRGGSGEFLSIDRRDLGCVYGAECSPAIVLRRRRACVLGDIGVVTLLER